ncbi:MAG: amidohydrolase family protein [Pseudomonadota bacterium]
MRIYSAAILIGLAILPPPSQAEATLYHGFSRVDITLEAVIPDSWIIVEHERIVAVGENALPEDFSGRRRNLSGTWALPGMIDGHAHITAGPHKVEVTNGQPTVTIESVDTITRYNALMALAYGVTTVRNPGGDPEANARYDANIASRRWRGPTALHAGAIIQPPPFGGNAFAYPTTRDGWFAEAERQARLGMTYFKLYTSLTAEELAVGIEAAHAHGLQAIAHLDQVSWQTALDLGIDGLEHALPTSAELLPEAHRVAFRERRLEGSKHLAEWFALVDFDGPEMQQLFAALADRGTTLNLTLLVNHMVAYADDVSAVIDDAAVRDLHPDTWAASSQFLAMGAAYWNGDDFTMARDALERVAEFLRRLHQAGIPLLIGTDGNGGGALMALEMQLHVDAGLTPFDVLDLATTAAARTMGLESTGRLEPGYEADVVFVSADPTAHIGAVRAVRAVLVDGEYLTREQLVTEARSLLD